MNYQARYDKILEKFPAGAYVESNENIAYLSDMKIIHASSIRKCRIEIQSEGIQFFINKIYQPLVPDAVYSYMDGDNLPEADASLACADDYVTEMRYIKSSEEVAALKQAMDLADWGMAHFKRLLKPGKVFMQVRFEVAAILSEEANRRESEGYWSIVVSGAAGPSASPHIMGRESVRKLQVGDVVSSVLIIGKDGYNIECERTFVLGDPSAGVQKCFEAILAAQDAALDVCKEGKSISSIEDASLKVFREYGMTEYVLHRAGHGMGIALQEFPTAPAACNKPFQNGMVLAVEPALYVPGIGAFRHSDTVVVGKGMLNKYPRDLDNCIIRV